MGLAGTGRVHSGEKSSLQLKESVHPRYDLEHLSQLKKETERLVQLDMANAYDRLNHAFLFITLLKFSFSREMVNLIKACINGPWIAPSTALIDSKADFFKASRGLRQGCPLYNGPLLVHSYRRFYQQVSEPGYKPRPIKRCETRPKCSSN